jgi:hypothetical protein
LAVALTLSGCATGFSPTPIDEVPFKSRAQTQTRGGVTVTTAVPTSEETIAIYGVNLASRDIQPVWIEIENREDEPLWLLTAGVDSAYFSAAEATHAFSPGDDRLSEHFKTLRFDNPIYPGTTVSGFLIVNRDEGYKALDIDLLSREDVRSFTYIIEDPSFKGDYTLVDFATLYARDEIEDIDDLATLRRTLEQLPCCTTNEDGGEKGDPGTARRSSGPSPFCARSSRSCRGPGIDTLPSVPCTSSGGNRISPARRRGAPSMNAIISASG